MVKWITFVPSVRWDWACLGRSKASFSPRGRHWQQYSRKWPTAGKIMTLERSDPALLTPDISRQGRAEEDTVIGRRYLLSYNNGLFAQFALFKANLPCAGWSRARECSAKVRWCVWSRGDTWHWYSLLLCVYYSDTLVTFETIRLSFQTILMESWRLLTSKVIWLPIQIRFCTKQRLIRVRLGAAYDRLSLPFSCGHCSFHLFSWQTSSRIYSLHKVVVVMKYAVGYVKSSPLEDFIASTRIGPNSM